MKLIMANITTQIIREMGSINDIVHSINELPDNAAAEWGYVHDELLKATKHIARAYAAASDIMMRGVKNDNT